MSPEKVNKIELEVRELSKRFGSFDALSQVSFQIRSGSIHAIVGENGAGKTTLLKLLFGLHKPTSGEIFFKEKKIQWQSPMDAIENGVGMVQQHFTLVEDLSAIDNIILGAEPVTHFKLNRELAIRQLEESLSSSFLAVPWMTPVKDLSVGQKQKVEILKLLYRKSKVLFLDEPTAVLAPHEIEEFFQFLRTLKKQGNTIVIITHKLKEVFSLCDEITVLKSGRTIATKKSDEVSPEQVIELMIGRRMKPTTAPRKPVQPQVVLDCKNLKDRTIERGAMRDISLNVKKGEIVGIAGVEGSGQSHLVEALLGLRPYGGLLQFNEHEVKKKGLVPEDRLTQGLWPQETCYHNLVIGLESQFSKYGWMNESAIRSKTVAWARDLDVRTSALTDLAGNLSGGNQQKIILARETRGRKADFYICHHPTRGVDIGAIELIYDEFFRLRNEGQSLLVISPDLDELMTLSDRIYVLFNGKTVKEFSRAQFDAFQIGQSMTGLEV